MKKKEEKEEKIQLLAEKRTVFGKKLKKLIKKGLLPGNIFGQEIKSQAIAVPLKDFARLFRRVGQSQIISLQLGKNGKVLPVLIHQIQKHPVTDVFLHVDFRQVNLQKKIKTKVPIKFINEAVAVQQNKGVVLTLADHLEIESLPTAIPKAIEIDLSSLKEADDEIKVKDIKIAGDYSIVDSLEKPIVRIVAHKEETTEPQVAPPETVEITTEKKPKEETKPGETNQSSSSTSTK